jgi:hypothetical protein
VFVYNLLPRTSRSVWQKGNDNFFYHKWINVCTNAWLQHLISDHCFLSFTLEHILKLHLPHQPWTKHPYHCWLWTSPRYCHRIPHSSRAITFFLITLNSTFYHYDKILQTLQLPHSSLLPSHWPYQATSCFSPTIHLLFACTWATTEYGKERNKLPVFTLRRQLSIALHCILI